ncbi:MAG: outer membrane beta-barrel protein [Ignavibacteria bacterium]|nr:outer membrane beta-barrel protein [Ignavibacteria bacterium]
MNKFYAGFFLFLCSVFSYSQSESVALGFGGKFAVPAAGFNDYAKNGFEADGTILVAVARQVGIELAIGYGKFVLKNSPEKSSIEEISVLPGIRYFADTDNIIPYVSLNFGLQNNKVKLKSESDSTASLINNHFSEKNNLAVQCGVGLLTRLSSDFSFDLSVNYRIVQKSSFLSANAKIFLNIY